MIDIKRKTAKPSMANKKTRAVNISISNEPSPNRVFSSDITVIEDWTWPF